jgi:two-component system invasion response regulator UvrY
MEITNIVIVDDENLFRELLCRTLSNERGLKIVGQAEDGESAIRITEEIKPDVVLMDTEFSECSGIEAIRRIHKMPPQTKIVVFSNPEADDNLFPNLESGLHHIRMLAFKTSLKPLF